MKEHPPTNCSDEEHKAYHVTMWRTNMILALTWAVFFAYALFYFVRSLNPFNTFDFFWFGILGGIQFKWMMERGFAAAYHSNLVEALKEGEEAFGREG